MRRLFNAWIALGLVSIARADDAPPSSAPTIPPPASAPAAPKSREEMLEERLRKMDEMNQRLMEQVELLSKKVEGISRDTSVATASSEASPTLGREGSGSDGESGESSRKAGGPQGTIGRGTNRQGGQRGEGGRGPSGSVEGGGSSNAGGDGRARGGQGTIGRTREDEKPRKINTTVSNGLKWTSEDDEFQVVLHNLTQAETRNFPGAGGQSPLKSQFFIPRQRLYFTGRVTKNVEFYTVINRGYGSLDLLDAFIDLDFDPRAKFRVGRTKTPTSYEYYQIAEGDLIAPERSLYTGNLSGNRQDGFMFLGQVLEKRAEYALGVFNGPRRSFQDFNNDKDLYAFFNFRPFEYDESLPGLKYFNVGGEYDFGNESNPVQPSSFHTANDQSSAASNATLASLSPTFLVLNNNVREYGPRDHYSAWVAWYYKSFNLLAQYDGGGQDYALGTGTSKIHVPTQGFFVQGYYFLTGEQITRRVDIRPLKNFAFKNGRLTGPGAIEVQSRISTLDLGRSVFDGGLADPNLWANHAYAVDTGINWYLNQYTKIYFDWQHSGFNQGVFNGNAVRGPAELTRSINLIWLRFQLFF